MTKAFFAIAVVAMPSFFSCNEKETPVKKETENVPKEPTTQNLIGTYLITKVEGFASGQRTDITNTWFSSYAGDCAKDDITEFKPDDSFIVLDGRVECDESTNDTGTWSLISKTQLKIDTDTARIEEFTDKTLRIVSPVYSTAQGDIIFTYTRQ